MSAWLLAYRRPIVVAVHIGFAVLANYGAFLLRFDGAIPPGHQELFVAGLPWLIAMRAVALYRFHLFQGMWRYTGIWDLRNILGAVAVSSVAFAAFVTWGPLLPGYPRSVIGIDAILLVGLMSGARLARRIHRALGRLERERRVLIYGAGDAGEILVRDMVNNPLYQCEPIGFIDDDAGKVGRRIHGVTVLGTRRELAEVVATTRPQEVLIAMPHVERARIRDIVAQLESFKVQITTLPGLRDMVDGRISVSEIRRLSPEDLLERVQVRLEDAAVASTLAGRRVLVTGAGGSIGSELSRQIARYKPELLVLFERYENNLYEIHSQIDVENTSVAVVPVLGDVTDASRLGMVMEEYRPDIVFHAAAHKHVPLVELNRCEAVKNNVTGTRIAAEMAHRMGVERFILISSDKAVNPSSVMGATKRVAELVVQCVAARSDTRFITVRFGNVLNSNGSVVPRFLEQIKAGGPVTVTDPEMRRYFMLIPEAVQLVLHTAALGEPGVFVLDMGAPIRILDLARNVIRLSGYIPDKEIPIRFVGMRPGEKLSEDLVGADEILHPSAMNKILRVEARSVLDIPGTVAVVEDLERLAMEDDVKAVLEKLAAIVPTFSPRGGNGG